MNKFLTKWIILILAVSTASFFVSGIVISAGVLGHPALTAIVAGFVLTVLHILVKPILKVLTFPITIITFGLFAILLNVLLFWFVAPLVPGFAIMTFMDALFGAIIVGVIQWVLDKIV